MEENLLERILEGSMKPTDLPLETLRKITDGFSADRIIGEGGFATVYKGVVGNKNVAVKRIKSSMTIDQKFFRREVDSLLEVNHQNVVRFLGLCSHTVETPMKNPESRGYIYVEKRERLLCFEYISNGSLDKKITDELRGLEWDKRYKIIKGICAGLQYLHEEKRILHMDLKPANILLDNELVPKITDFGLSRPTENSQTMSTNHFCSPGYCAPENMFSSGRMSIYSDIYSLGVIIIELVTGRKGIPDNNYILRRWRHRWNKSVNKIPHEYHRQVTTCIEIGSLCQKINPYARPSLSIIMRKFVELESMNNPRSTNKSTEINPLYWEDDMLWVEPLELRFGRNKRNHHILSCSVELSNNTDGFIAFNIQKTNMLPYTMEPNKDIVKPRSKCNVDITLPVANALDHKASRQYNINKLCTEEFIVRSIKVNKPLTTDDIAEHMFDEHTRSHHVDEIVLSVVSDEPCREELGQSSDVMEKLTSLLRTCARCHSEIGDVRFLKCMGADWHPDCFCCHNCNQPIYDNEFSMSGNHPYHKTCYKECFEPKCDVCKQFIPTNMIGLIEYRAHPFWLQKYCPSHEVDGTLRCCSCERMEPRESSYVLLDDGRKLCVECLDSAVMDTNEGQPLYLEIQEFYEGLNMKVKQHVPLLLVERRALNEAMEGEKTGDHHLPETRGLCLSEERTVSTITRRPRMAGNKTLETTTEPSRLIHRCEVTAILILYGLPRLLTGSILANMMMHAWFRLKGYRTLSQDIEEGICQVLAHMWIEFEIMGGSGNKAASSSSTASTSSKKGGRLQFKQKLGDFLKYQIESNTSSGDSFRAGNRAVVQYGLKRTLEQIQLTGTLPFEDAKDSSTSSVPN